MGATKLPLTLYVVTDGEQALRFFESLAGADASRCPDLVILDINLPKKTGADVLQYLRQSPNCAGALVLVVSTSQSERDRERMTKLGADRYFKKPSHYDEFMKLGDLVKELLASRTC
jgi:chemotaxis family two-component system response regulator Rcp1